MADAIDPNNPAKATHGATASALIVCNKLRSGSRLEVIVGDADKASRVARAVSSAADDRARPSG